MESDEVDEIRKRVLKKKKVFFQTSRQLWQLKPTDDNFDSCSQLSIVLTAVTSCKQFGQLLQAFKSFGSCYKLSTLLTVFSSCCPLPNKFKLKFDQDFE